MIEKTKLKTKTPKKAVKKTVKSAVKKPAIKKISAKSVKKEIEPIILAKPALKPLVEIKKEEPKTDLLVKINQYNQSPHLINLKNPYNNSDQNQPTAKSAIVSRPKFNQSSAVKPPKDFPKRLKTLGIDFSATKKEKFNLFDWLGLTSLFQLITQPFKKPQPRMLYRKPLNFANPTPVYNPVSISQTVREIEEEVEDVFAKPSRKKIFNNFYLPADWAQKLATFVIVSIILVSPLQAFTYYQDLSNTKDRILIATNEAIENLKSGQQAAVNMDLNGANSQFGLARLNFLSAENEIGQLNALTSEILKIIPGLNKTVSTGVTMLEAGKIIAETGEILADSGQNFINNKNDIKGYFQSLISLDANLKLAITKFNEAKTKIEKIQPNDLPAEHRETFAKVLGYLPEISKGLSDIHLLNKSLLKVLGQNQWQRYLVVFLNNNELRATGGFMGSFALVDIDQGQIKKIEIPGGGTYDMQGSLVPKVLSPKPLQLLNTRWEFQDSNWWPDYPTTAKKVEWFYQNAGGPSVDGVIMLTAEMMERLLDIYGPIPMPEYGRTITSQNFVLETQKIVELEYDKKENRPKQFLADMAPKLLQRIFSADKDQLFKTLNLLKDSLNQRHLMIYFNDESIENVITDFGWSGQIRQTDGDYLSVIQTNLAGGKTDAVIKESIQHQAEIQSDGTIIDTVKLIRRHTGKPGENVFTGVQNNSYVRFYVPLGSTLISAEGFKKPEEKYFDKPKPEYQADIDLLSVETDKSKDEKSDTDIYKESSKTVFGNWLQLKPGEVSESIIKYRLPFSVSLGGQETYYYSLLVQKQAGTIDNELKSNLKLNDKLKPLAKFPADLPSDNTGISFTANLLTDKFYGAVLVNK
ncbi:MAG: DUF4012 domain-containing protein [Candidatus Buchananbacteria bacterium]